MAPTPSEPPEGGCTRAAAFERMADALLGADPALDRTSLYLRAEASTFLRFNHGALRQATSVEQAHVTLTVERGQRRAQSELSLSGDAALDLRRLREERAVLVGQLELIPQDPWLRRPLQRSHSTREDAGELPTAEQVIAQVYELAGAARRHDLVGFYAGGPVVHAFADSLGSRHWHRVESFHFDWCLYRGTDQAVKSVYAATHWRAAEFARLFEQAAQRVPLLDRAVHRLQPGEYRAALSPAAMVELLSASATGSAGATFD